MTSTPTVYRLTTAELAATRARIDSVNARCARHGLPEVILTATRVDLWVTFLPDGDVLESDTAAPGAFPAVRHDVTITGGRPHLNGYELLGEATFLPAGGVLVHTAPGIDARAVDRERLVPGACDHCGTARERAQVYLVADASTGAVSQIGTRCAETYLGMNTSPVFAQIVPTREGDDDDACSNGGERGLRRRARGDDTVPTGLALAVACRSVRRHGFVSSASQTQRPTVYDVRDAMWPSGSGGRLPFAEIEDHLEEASRILTYYSSAAAVDEFTANLQALACEEWLTRRDAGFIAAMPSAYDRAVLGDQERELSQFLGTEGEKITVTGVVRRLRYLDPFTRYGRAPRQVIMATEARCLVEWRTTSGVADTLEVGQTVTMTGAVKAHRDAAFGKVTRLAGRVSARVED